MATSVKSKAELEQIALAMMMMAGGEGTSTVTSEAEEVGVKTRSTRSSSGRNSAPSTPHSLPNLRRRSQTQQKKDKQEPVSGNCLNKNRNRKNHDQREEPEQEPEPPALSSPAAAGEGKKQREADGYVEADDNDGELDQSNLMMETSATDLVVRREEVPEDNESIVCAINPMTMFDADVPDEMAEEEEAPESPTESQKSNNSLGGGGRASNNGNTGGEVGTSSSDCVYMSSSRRIFRPEFKQKVLDAFQNDPDCVGNQRATARKFGIHRRQVQKWLQQHAAGELTFKVSPKQQDEEQHYDSYPDTIELTSNKPVAAGKRVLTRRGVGSRVNQNFSTSDLPPRPSRLAARAKGKSMPLKGGSNKSHFPTIIHPSSPKTLNLSKAAAKQNGGSAAAAAASSSYGYYSDTNGNGSSVNANGNMFMNMSTLLASAAAAGNLAMPLSLENPRNFSPRDHSPINNNGRGSPAHSAGGSSGSGSNNYNLQNALMLVDELNYLYPNADFSLLRKALLKEEVSLEKLSHPLIRSKFAEFRMNGNGVNTNLGQDLTRSVAPSPPLPGKSRSVSQDYNTQQTLDIIRQQQEYLKLLQQCGIGNSSDLSGLNLAELASNGGRLPTWFNPFAAAATAGLQLPSTSTGNGKLGMVNGGDGGSGRRKENSDNHRFASPRAPPAVNSGKAKTVAAALAATRVQSTPPQQVRNYSLNQMERNGGRQSQNQRSAGQRRKPKGRPSSRTTAQVDDDIDPTSMLEVVTNIPSPPSSSPRTNKNHYGYNGNHRNTDYNQHGMDLTTTTSSSNTTTSTTTSTTTRLISKAMNKEYSFFNVLGLVRKNPEEAESTPSSSSNNNGFGLTHTASLENFVQNILPSSSADREKSPQNLQASSSTSSNSPPASDINDSDKTKNMVIEAFRFDPEISGDARAVARKFGLNARVVMKWLKEAPMKNEGYHENGTNDNNNLPLGMNGGDDEEYLQTQNLHKAMLNESNNNSPGSGGGATGVNKRKNSKPNQICDFPVDDEAGLNGALDMVVPIKKRRVSSPSPTPQDTQ